MNSMEFLAEMESRFGATPEYLWAKFPDTAVFRHSHNAKWFCLLIKTLPADKLVSGATGLRTIVNLKSPPELVGNLRTMKGGYPAYHMNKEHWLSLDLAEIEPDLLWQLVEQSRGLTR